MPRLLTRGERPAEIGYRVAGFIGTLAGIKSERWPTSIRNRWPACFGIRNLVGSTELSARLDPEDMGRVIRAYQEACTEVIERWGGHVAKYMGDGVLAYFGWPHAHEDEAERAVRSGLAMIETFRGVGDSSGRTMAARLGIATGLAMVGELIGVGAAQEQTVVGETPNLAARLQTLAAPGAVVISQATRRLVGGLFELADLGPQRLKGFAEPLAAFRVVGGKLRYLLWFGTPVVRSGPGAGIAVAGLSQLAKV